MVSEALNKFTDELKFIRESKGITLQQIAAKTKIDLKFLKAIEDANFDILPDIYIRAFIKEYSQTLDLDPKEILQKFDNAKSGKQVEKPTEEVHPDNNQHEKLQEKLSNAAELTETSAPLKAFESEETLMIQPVIPEVKQINEVQTNYIIGALITVVAILIIYFSFFNGSSSEIIQVSPDQEITSNKNDRFELEKQTAKGNKPEDQTARVVQPLSTDSLHLSVLTTDRVWVKVSTDGKIVQQGIIEANSKMNYAAKKSFSVSVGNAGRVKVFFNNKPVENVGKPGEIRNLFITSDGVKYFTIPPQKNEEKSPTKN